MKKETLSEPKLRNREWKFAGFKVGHGIHHFESCDSHSASSDRDVVRLHFGLKGDYRFTHKQLDQQFDLAGGHHNIMYSPTLDLIVENKTLLIETFGVEFQKSKFLELLHGMSHFDWFCEAIKNNKPVIISPNWGTVDHNIQGLIDEIILNPYSGQMQDLFLQGKCLELLVLCLDNYSKSVRTNSIIKSEEDKRKLIAARDYINSRVDSPPTLTEISKEVGLNEFKLKNGFKEMFHNTLFGYVTERRMNLALQYLLNTTKTAAEIAFELGYSSPQHFSAQFRKKFGQTPNSMRKNP